LLSAGLEKVINIFCNGAKMKVFAQSAEPAMNMFLCFPLQLTKRSRTASANTIGCKPFFRSTCNAHSNHSPPQASIHSAAAALRIVSMRAVLRRAKDALGSCIFQVVAIKSCSDFGERLTKKL
jgi:hypothetical protein